jgi:hypothetical protein
MLRIVHPDGLQIPVASLKNCQERWRHRASYTSAVLNNTSIRLHAFSAWSWL